MRTPLLAALGPGLLWLAVPAGGQDGSPSGKDAPGREAAVERPRGVDREGAADRLALPPAPGWLRVDGVIAQAGDEVVRESDVRRVLRSARGGLSVSSSAELAEVVSDALQALLVRKLEAQAGEDRAAGRSEQIDSLISRNLAERRQRLGIVPYTESLQEDGLDPRADEEAFRRERLTAAFRHEESRTYVRPGEIRALYRTSGRSLLGRPAEVQLQVLQVDAAAAGGPEAARELALDLRGRALRGEDFSLLVEEYSATMRQTHGLSEMLRVDGLRPGLREFAAEAPLDAISAPMGLREPSGAVFAWQIVRIVDRDEGPPLPPFDDRAAQERIRSRVSREREAMALAAARQRLFERALLWVGATPSSVEGSVEGSIEGSPAAAEPR